MSLRCHIKENGINLGHGKMLSVEEPSISHFCNITFLKNEKYHSKCSSVLNGHGCRSRLFNGHYFLESFIYKANCTAPLVKNTYPLHMRRRDFQLSRYAADVIEREHEYTSE